MVWTARARVDLPRLVFAKAGADTDLLLLYGDASAAPPPVYTAASQGPVSPAVVGPRRPNPAYRGPATGSPDFVAVRAALWVVLVVLAAVTVLVVGRMVRRMLAGAASPSAIRRRRR